MLRKKEEKLGGKIGIRMVSIAAVALLLAIIIQGINTPTVGIVENKKFFHGKSIIPEQIHSNNYQGSSFHTKTTQNNSWIVVKFSSVENIFIDEISIYTHFMGENMRLEDENIILTNLKNKTYELGGAGCGVGGVYDLFIHMEVGPFNFTYDHLARGENYNEGRFHSANITLFPDTWYLICWIAYDQKAILKQCSIEVWINTSDEDIQFLGITQGNTSFLYNSIDFFGNINIWSHAGTLLINGEKSIVANNFFIGKFFSFSTIIEKLGYTNPDGVTKEVIKIEIHRPCHPHHPWVFMYGDLEVYEPLTGGPGVWQIRIGAYGSYEMFFTYADIKLP